MIRRFLKNLQSTRQRRTIVRYYDFLNSLAALSPELVRVFPSGRKVLVFAPHCDDETAGCGGAIYKHGQAGNAVTAVFLTDGSRCRHNAGKSEIIATRKREAAAAGKILGIDRLVFLDNEDRRLQKTEKTVDQVSGILADVRPDMVYLPFFLDNHPDHQAAASIYAAAAKKHAVEEVFFYEIWSALMPTHLVDISEVIDVKMQAMLVYQSQTAIGDLAEQVKSLNRFRSLNSDNMFRYAEAFFMATGGNLSRLVDD